MFFGRAFDFEHRLLFAGSGLLDDSFEWQSGHAISSEKCSHIHSLLLETCWNESKVKLVLEYKIFS